MPRPPTLASLALALLSLAACRRPTPPGDRALSSSASPALSALPPDRTLPGELAEGTASVAGLVLPRDFRVVRVFDGEHHAIGPSSPEQVASYLRRRLDAPQSEIGPSRTLFPLARVRSPGAASSGNLRVEVNARDSGSEIVVTEIKPVVIEPNLSEEERWRRTGLKKGGGLADPQNVF